MMALVLDQYTSSTRVGKAVILMLASVMLVALLYAFGGFFGETGGEVLDPRLVRSCEEQLKRSESVRALSSSCRRCVC